MNKIRLSKSGIEYLNYNWGVFSGCKNQQNGICNVPRCWAKGLASRFHKIYPNGFEPTFYPEVINSPKYLKKPSRIGVGWVGDVIGYCDKGSERSLIMRTILQCPQHTFVFLTKNPDKLIKWHFPENCWVGVTATDSGQTWYAMHFLKDIDAPIRFISFEPLLNQIANDSAWPLLNALKECNINWLIIGQQTPISAKTQPKIEWIQEIVEVADKVGIPVFLKNNLKPLFGKMTSKEAVEYGNLNKPHIIEEVAFVGNHKLIAHKLRQELPL